MELRDNLVAILLKYPKITNATVNELEFFIQKLLDKKRTPKQNNAMHKYFTLVAEQFNSAGLGMREVLKTETYIEWTMESIKKYLWKPFMVKLTEKEHTADLEKSEIDRIYEHLNLYLGENPKTCSLPHIPFPRKEEPKELPAIEYPQDAEEITAF